MKKTALCWNCLIILVACAAAPDATSQTQSLAFTGGVFLNPQVSFRGAGNAGVVEDTGDFVHPSANLEYRGSLGALGKSDWGILLGLGYQPIGGEVNGAFGFFDLSADLLPIAGGLYLETQLAGRLNGVVSGGFLAVLVNGDLRYRESIGTPPVTSEGFTDSNKAVFGGFVQLGLDWAFWEKASLVAMARWQPTESFRLGVNGREAEVDFFTAFAVQAGVAFRF
jgi:hypothetical protein